MTMGEGAVRINRGKAALILLARMDSRRLPGKGLMDLGGRSVLGLALDRLACCDAIGPRILATGKRVLDDPLQQFAETEGISCFRGDLANVAGRCLAACDDYNLDWFIRICGDSPFVPPEIVMQVADAFTTPMPDGGAPDIATNVFPASYPTGTSAEAVSRAALARICAETTDLAYLEHVTLYAYEHADAFRIVNVAPPDDRYADLKLSVDTPDDLARARRIYAALTDPVKATLDQVAVAARAL